MAIDPTFVPGTLVQTPGYSLTAPFQDLGVVPPGGTHYSVYIGIPRGTGTGVYTPDWLSPVTVSVAGSVFVSTLGGFGGVSANLGILAEVAAAWTHDAWSGGTPGFFRYQCILTLTDSLATPTWTATIPFGIAGSSWGGSPGDFVPALPHTFSQISSGSVDNPAVLSAWLDARVGTTAHYVGTLTMSMEADPQFFPLYNWTFTNGVALAAPGGQAGVHDSFYTSGGFDYEKMLGNEFYPFSAGYPPPGSFPHNGYNYTMSETFRLTITDTVVFWSFPTPAARAGNAWVLQDRYGRYHSVEKRAGAIRYMRSDHSVPLPSWAVDVDVGSIGALPDPRIAIDFRDQIHLIAGSGGISETVSNDGGKTWNTATVALAGAKHGTITCLEEVPGTTIIAGYLAGNLVGTVQHGGDATASSVFTMKDNTGASMQVEDDTFHLDFAHDGSGRILMAVNILSETAVSHWQCWDGEGRTWTRIV